jgi:hypothetical protein
MLYILLFYCSRSQIYQSIILSCFIYVQVMLYWHIYTDTVCGGGVYKCMRSGVSESSVFQNAVSAVRAHVPVLAWDGVFYMGTD